MDAAAAESTQDWLVPEGSRPPTIGELERRIDEALVTARASEAAVMTVGAAAFDAAEQARRAAELAERASAAALAGGRPTAAAAALPGEEEEDLRDFSERADRLVARLRQLQRVPLGAPAASGVADR
jgi:3-deoxy-D-arabino-heptulosonate 7-phosphate (DAHP) synthase